MECGIEFFDARFGSCRCGFHFLAFVDAASTFSTVCRLSSSICVLRLASLFLRVSAAGFSVSSGRRAESLVFLVDTLSLASLFIRGGGPRRWSSMSTPIAKSLRAYSPSLPSFSGSGMGIAPPPLALHIYPGVAGLPIHQTSLPPASRTSFW